MVAAVQGDAVTAGQQRCAVTGIPWIRTSAGPKTVRDALLTAHQADGLDEALNGIQTGALVRYLTAVVALVLRFQTRPGREFRAEAVDAALAVIGPYSDILNAERPFLQTPTSGKPPKPGKEFPVKKLLPWMPADRAEDFWSDSAHPIRLVAADAVMALAVHHHYSFGGNNKIEGRACANGSPGIRYPGVGYTATEVLWNGSNLFETLLLNTPKSWVQGSGLPAWADPDCVASSMGAGKPEHPLWRATWGSNTAICLWDGTDLVAVTTGGTTTRPPSMGADKAAMKAWWDARNTNDTFYLYVDIEKKNAKGIVLSSERKAQRLDFGHSTTDLAVEWNSKNLSSAVRRRSQRMVRTPEDEQIMFLRHLVEGNASSPVVRRTEVLLSSPKKWIIDEDRAYAVSDASVRVKAVLSELCKPFTENGRLASIRDRRPDIEAAYWQKIAQPFEQFIINGEGDAIDPSVWPAVRTAALSAFDEVTASAPAAKLAPFIMTARNRVASNITQTLSLAPQREATR